MTSSETTSNIDFERWYRELEKKYMIIRELLEAKADECGAFKFNYDPEEQLHAVRHQLMKLKLSIEWTAETCDGIFPSLKTKFTTCSDDLNLVLQQLQTRKT